MTLYLFLLLLAFECRASPKEERFWPLNNVDHEVDLPQSSPFGPRNKISEGSRYDYHRGVDIPAELGTEVYAIDDGTVRIGGLYHSAYSDGVVQLRHTGWDDEGDISKSYYSTYIHLNESFVEGMEDRPVSKGQLIGRTWETNNFPHLHFEIRAGGLRQDSNCNPWKYLPCPQCSSFRVNTTLTPNEGGEICSVTVTVSVPPNQLTFNRVRLVVTGDVADYDKDFDLCADNTYYTNNPTYSPSRLDNPNLIDYLTITPHFFNSQSYAKNQWSATDYKFKKLPQIPIGGIAMATAYVYDVFENEVLSSPVNYSCPAPPIVSSPSPSTGMIESTGVPSPSSSTGMIENTEVPSPIPSTGMIENTSPSLTTETTESNMTSFSTTDVDRSSSVGIMCTTGMYQYTLITVYCSVLLFKYG